jgi:CubicO group peptidase (beta-lactamase class C family)
VRLEGTTAKELEPVRDAFADVLRAQDGTGAAVAIWRDGEFVVDLWGGTADTAGRPWQRDSIVQPYSVSKPFAALPALLLVDRGLLDLDAPAQRYWPELRAAATVRELLSHQGGIVAIDEPADTGAFLDWDRMCALLAKQEPAWPPGTGHGESALFYGHLVGELVRRVDGRTPGRFLRDEVCGPLGLDFAFGLTPAEQARAVELTGLTGEFRRAMLESRPPLYEKATANPPGAFDPAVVNGAAWRAAEVPAINGHGTARALAGLYAALLSGELLSAGLLAEATTAQSRGTDLVFGHENAWGLGFAVDGADYGMGGLGGSYAGTADGYAIGFVTGTMGDHDRVDRVENAYRACVGLPPLPD